jgi:hypothetical protein
MPSKQPERARATVSWGGQNQRRQDGGDRGVGGNARHETPRSCPRPRFQVRPGAHHPFPGDDHRPRRPGGMAPDNLAKPTPEGTSLLLLRPKTPSSSAAGSEQLSISVLSPMLQASPERGSTARPTSAKVSAACAQLPQRPLLPHNERAPAPCASASPRSGLKSPA